VKPHQLSAEEICQTVMVAGQQAPAMLEDAAKKAEDNCHTNWSCGNIGCHRVFGGSEYIWNNGIRACRVDSNPKCYDVNCKVATYLSPNCSGDSIDGVHEYDRRGCKKQR
jgi:hypothetical protein